jgi:pyruvate, water dikinase
VSADLILPLDAVRTGDIQFVGRKAAGLGELAAARFPVPPAFVVTTTAFRRFFSSLGLQDEIDRIDKATEKELRDCCRRIQQRILSGAIAKDIAGEILGAHVSLVGTDEQARTVIRSSATAEDLAEASFAGQHRTYYYVESAFLLEIVRHCWASLWSTEAASYRAAHGISHRAVAMAVIVQRMVSSDVSGIAFTADPITLDPRTIIIESSWGLGAAIMDGRVTPDRHIVNRHTLQVRERRVAEKRVMVPADPVSSEGFADVSHDRRNVETLNPQQIEAVAALAIRCERHFGSPQDVEWALAHGELHLLQSRPITTLRRKQIAVPAGKWVLFKPVIENFTDPLTPLQIDLMKGVFAGFLRPIGDRFYVNITPVRWLLPLDLSDEAVASLIYLTGDGVPGRVRPRLLKP